jgi:hypothetical protein
VNGGNGEKSVESATVYEVPESYWTQAGGPGVAEVSEVRLPVEAEEDKMMLLAIGCLVFVMATSVAMVFAAWGIWRWLTG